MVCDSSYAFPLKSTGFSFSESEIQVWEELDHGPSAVGCPGLLPSVAQPCAAAPPPSQLSRATQPSRSVGVFGLDPKVTQDGPGPLGGTGGMSAERGGGRGVAWLGRRTKTGHPSHHKQPIPVQSSFSRGGGLLPGGMGFRLKTGFSELETRIGLPLPFPFVQPPRRAAQAVVCHRTHNLLNI